MTPAAPAQTRIDNAFRLFVGLWLLVLVAKVVLALRLPLFVDEAFYWQEGQHLAWAYSDLPGLTAWMSRLGVTLFGDGMLAARLPFLLVASAVPWLVARLSAREFGPLVGWQAGTWALLLPLLGSLGLLALPDAAMALATVICMDAGLRLLRKVDATSSLLLALGLALGALSHYRFLAVVAVGFAALLLLREGREALRNPQVWVAIAFGAAAWAPLLAWNVLNAEAGLRFQLVDRHPWAFHPEGIQFLGIQAAMVTPLLLLALGLAAWHGVRSEKVEQRFLALLGALMVLGFFVLGFFADIERVSFHWPLPGYIALLPLVPLALARWPRGWRIVTAGLAALGLLATLGYYAFVSTPQWREQTANSRWYPSNFAGWDELAAAVSEELQSMPGDTQLVADNFKVGAELGFALGDPRIPVLAHELNRRHGRAPQLVLWGLKHDGNRDTPLLLVASDSDVKFSELQSHYQSLCERFGPLPPPRRVVNVDHGARRFVLLALPAQRAEGDCVTPAIAHIDVPEAGSRVSRRFEVGGWAIKDGVGVARVEVTLDGKVVATARYGGPNDWVHGEFLRGISRDPNRPNNYFHAEVDASTLPPGRYWLGLQVHGADGGVEPGMEIPIDLR